LSRVALVQCAGPDSAVDLLSGLGAFSVQAAKAAARIARHGPFLASEGREYPLLPVALDVARSATLDLARAMSAHRATQRFLRRTPEMRGATVVFPTSAADAIAAVDVSLQQAGATTIEIFHGTGADYWHGIASSCAAVRCVWTEVDAALHQGVRHRIVVGGMPVFARARSRTHDQPRNVLVMTNLVHRDHLRQGYPLRPFQRGLLVELAKLQMDPGLSLKYRWRPHPADVEQFVQEDLGLAGGVELSRGRPLSEDLDWADIVISNQSTVLVEALLTDVPIIAHILPELILPTEMYLHPSRVLYRSGDLGPVLKRCLEDLAKKGTDALAPERYARQRLFGAPGRPQPFSLDLLRSSHGEGDGERVATVAAALTKD
jgi:hypothetical protein